MALELEVKFLIADPADLARRLAEAGAAMRPRVHEINLLFDDAAGSLLARGLVLRLRQDDRVRLTFKAPIVGPSAPHEGGPAPAPGAMKAREELEIEVSDGAALRRILERLGFHPAFVYEKYRTTYRLGACALMLDETPLGTFLEVEGPPDAARAQAEALGLDWAGRLLDSYAGLFQRVRARLGLATAAMTFAALRGVDIPAEAVRP